MMPWRDQLCLGRDILRWLVWPRRRPAWENTTMLLAVVAATIGLERGTLWPMAGMIALSVTCSMYRGRKG